MIDVIAVVVQISIFLVALLMFYSRIVERLTRVETNVKHLMHAMKLTVRREDGGEEGP